jgi:hypothetical protein
MDDNMQAKLDSYLELFQQLKEKASSETVALTLLQELAKDRRMEEMREEKEAKNNKPATSKQKRFMDDLGIKYPKGVTKKEASMLIEEEIGKNGE